MNLIHGDCLEKLKEIADGSVDMVLADLPYGTTACKWDTRIPFEPLWKELHRVTKPNAAMCMFGSEPFSSLMRMSNLKRFKYDWVWKKTKKLGFTNAKNKPLNGHEICSIFSEGTCANKSSNKMRYYPQGLVEINKIVSGIKTCKADLADGSHGFGRKSHKEKHLQTHTGYPHQIIEFASESKPVHPTQKPVALLEYLIKTYTNEGDTVLDPTMGSGSTGIACCNLKRHFIGIEKELNYFEIAQKRIG